MERIVRPQEAAGMIGIAVSTLYDWLANPEHLEQPLPRPRQVGRAGGRLAGISARRVDPGSARDAKAAALDAPSTQGGRVKPAQSNAQSDGEVT